jgi:hypothetical protein
MGLSDITTLSIKVALVATICIGSWVGFCVSFVLIHKNPNSMAVPIAVQMTSFVLVYISMMGLVIWSSKLHDIVRKRNTIHDTKNWERQFEKLEEKVKFLVRETTISTFKDSTREREKQRKKVESQYGVVERSLVDYASWNFALEMRNAKTKHKPNDWEEQQWTAAFMLRGNQLAARLEKNLMSRQRALLDQACKVSQLTHGKERIAATDAIWCEFKSVTDAKMAFYQQGWPMADVKGTDLFELMMGVNLFNHPGAAQQGDSSLNDDQSFETKSWAGATSVNEIV